MHLALHYADAASRSVKQSNLYQAPDKMAGPSTRFLPYLTGNAMSGRPDGYGLRVWQFKPDSDLINVSTTYYVVYSTHSCMQRTRCVLLLHACMHQHQCGSSSQTATSSMRVQTEASNERHCPSSVCACLFVSLQHTACSSCCAGGVCVGPAFLQAMPILTVIHALHCIARL
jgi:hypothetical protein